MKKPSHTKDSAERVGLVGVGLMGSAIAQRLMESGFRVIAFDILPERTAGGQNLGCEIAADPREIAVGCQRILLSLYDSAGVRSVLDQIRGALRSGQLIIDTTTGDAETATIAGEELERLGVGYLAATISGNREQVLRQESTILAGGRVEVLQRCQDLLALLGATTVHVGNWGDAAKMKLVTNLVLGLNRAALAEGLVLANRLGLDTKQTLTVLMESPAYSRAMEAKGAKMVAGDFTPQARLSQHLKDLRLILEAAARSGQKLPLSQTHRELLELAERLGLGDRDNSAVLRAIESLREPGATR